MAFGPFYGYLVYFVVYFMATWFIFPHFGMLYQEKSGNPGLRSGNRQIRHSKYKKIFSRPFAAIRILFEASARFPEFNSLVTPPPNLEMIFIVIIYHSHTYNIRRKVALGKLALGETTLGKTTLSETTLGKTTLGKTTLGKKDVRRKT
jgi:hypothetical protein